MDKKSFVNKVPKHLRSGRTRLSQWVGRTILKISGWKIEGSIPNEERILIVAAPHTSNWDFVLGMATILGLNAKIKWIGKHTLFKPGLKWFFYWLGGIPVNREDPSALIEDVSIMVKKDKGLIIGIAPEGTRKKAKKWKSGFLRIAALTKSKILLLSIDSPSKTLLLGNFFEPTGDRDLDLRSVKEYYQSFKGINPSQS